MKGRVKVSSKNQIAIPAEARRKLNIRSGDTLIYVVVGDQLVLIQEPKDWVEYMEGLGKEVWEGVDVDEYIAESRGRWPA